MYHETAYQQERITQLSGEEVRIEDTDTLESERVINALMHNGFSFTGQFLVTLTHATDDKNEFDAPA